MDEPIDLAIAGLSRRQRGYITRTQLLRLGLGLGAIRYRSEIGRLIAVHKGVYAVGHLPTLPTDRARGALLACGKDAILSHSSAASLWGIRRDWEMPFEVTVPTARRRPGIRVHRSAAITADDVRIYAGLRVTSPARTLLDYANRLNDKRLTRAVNDFRLSGHLRLPDVAELLGRCPRHPQTRRLRPFVERGGRPTRSEFEDAFRTFLERFGLPQPEMNAIVNGVEVDAWFANERLIVELDGYEYHSGKDAFANDRDRDADMLVADLPTLRVTWERMMYTAEREAERLKRILAVRRRRHAA